MTKTVNITISDEDYSRMIEHLKRDRPGRPLVAVISISLMSLEDETEDDVDESERCHCHGLHRDRCPKAPY